MRRFLYKFFYALIALVALVFIVLLLASPRQTEPYPSQNDAPNSGITEIRDIELNNAKQRILIRGKDLDNPLLLHLHGGPGGVDQALLSAKGFNIEDLYTVVFWDQRGAGASYSSDLDQDTINLNQIVADGIALSEYLLTEFDQESLFLQGHSWGTLLGTHIVSKRPDLFSAYIGVGQFAHAKESEKRSYEFALSAANAASDAKALETLNEIGPPPYTSDQEWINNVMIQRGAMQPYEMPDGSMVFSMIDIYRHFVFYRGYSIPEKLRALEGSKVSLNNIWMEVVNSNLFESHAEFELPVFILQGKYDQHTVTSVAREYFDHIKAPQKEYYLFSNSAHWPHLKESEKYREILSTIRMKLR
ncbi:MAG: alpha/beta hydrolase [Pseudomonadota bacterium]